MGASATRWPAPRVATDTTSVLAEDPDLAAGLGRVRLVTARRACVARVMFVHPGAWAPESHDALVAGGFGLLVLSGLIMRRVGGHGRYGTELLGPGDLLRPWDHGRQQFLLPCAASYRVLQESRLAVLDTRFAARLTRYPEVAGALVERAMRRAFALAVHLAIATYPRVDHRLLLLFWHLARRWGQDTPHGVRLPLPINHQCLADLVAARRPSVSTGMARLSRESLITVASPGWLLHGEPPTWLRDTDAARGRPPGMTDSPRPGGPGSP